MPEKNNNHLVIVDSYLIEHAQEKVREQNGGKMVKPVLNDDQPQSQTSSDEDQKLSLD